MDANSPWYLWPTLIATLVAAIAGIWAAVTGSFSLSLQYGERAKRQADKCPRTTASLREESKNGWHLCLMTLRNRCDANARYTRVKVIKPKGFLIAPGEGPYGEDVDPAKGGANINPDWVLAPKPEPEKRKHLLVKPTVRMLGNKPITLKFTILIEDAEREELTLEVKTNAINWHRS